ncbi:O-acetyl-ADP-ribose deacetylase 1 isoform X3 [Python bivittatus]|uniref:O-acetyl-ADP-ribose deacetylase 1 isoform X3 n=1 Tax=Python bivittatus TaxID=176946 RepID=A0A9F5IKR4_PYTBI|nr:O-acetyl-ADP-ribose deacetylase 1 isoform X3 [Python bivittatus]
MIFSLYILPYIVLALKLYLMYCIFCFIFNQIKYVQGDLFTCPKTDSLAHCISEDCHMSAGIAAIFKKMFGGIQDLLNQHKKTGDVAVLKRETRYVYYLITKNKYFHKPTYDNLQKSLEAMKIHCLKNEDRLWT